MYCSGGEVGGAGQKSPVPYCSESVVICRQSGQPEAGEEGEEGEEKENMGQFIIGEKN